MSNVIIVSRSSKTPLELGDRHRENMHTLDQQAIAPHFIAFIIWDDTVVSKTLFMHVLFMQQVQKPFPPAADGHRDIPTRPR